jgi:FixJ family two-component response regulator
VYVVDDDQSVRDALEFLIVDAGWRPQVFASAQAFLDAPAAEAPQCLLLDMSLPDLSGLQLQRCIAADQPHRPIIFITGTNDVPNTVAAMKAGAYDFLTKPVGSERLLESIRGALARSHAALSRRAASDALQAAHASLTGRERDVMSLVVAGRLNKHIASELGISIVTVKAHRGKVMQKMAATSVADLVRMDARLRAERVRALAARG